MRKAKRIGIEAVMVVILFVLCVMVALHAQEKPAAPPQLKDRPAVELARAALPLVNQLADVKTQEALLQNAFITQEQTKAKINTELQGHITAALRASEIDPDKCDCTVDMDTLKVTARPKPPTPPAAPPAK